MPPSPWLHVCRPRASGRHSPALAAAADASAIGTTVLRIKEIPPRPAALDGCVHVGGLAAGVEEAALRSGFARCGAGAVCRGRGPQQCTRMACKAACSGDSPEEGDDIPQAWQGVDERAH